VRDEQLVPHGPGRHDTLHEPALAGDDTALRARHADTLGGALMPLETIAAVHVELSISAASAVAVAGQHLALHAANLLGRLEGVVGTMSVSVEQDMEVALHAGVDPRHPRGGASLIQAVKLAATLASPQRVRSPHERDGPRRSVRVRIGAGGDADCWVAAPGAWLAFVGREPGPECTPDATLPLGAHAAAALAAGEVFRLARAKNELADGPRSLHLSTWSWVTSDHLLSDGPGRDSILAWLNARSPDGSLPPFTLVGVGAVGCAFMLTLWATDLPLPQAVLIDGDRISLTNLNRYVLFGRGDLGQWKARRAAALLRRAAPSSFRAQPIDRRWAEHRRVENAPVALLISAVDNNLVRHQLQDALPRLILGASTNGLRAQVDRYDLSDTRSRCLKCHNPPEPLETDSAMQARLLAMDDAVLRAEAADRGVASETLLRYVAEVRAGGTGCATVTGADLDKLRHADGEGAFGVSFASSLSGTLLCAQFVRELSAEGPVLTPDRSRGHFQVWRPSAAVNGPRAVGAQAGCWCREPQVRAAYREMWPQTCD